MSLSGQVAVLTGASSGIGVAVARNLRDAGMKLMMTARRAERLKQLCSELGNDNAAFVAGDMTDPDLPGRLLEETLKTFGRCDVVFNNAGVIEVASIEAIDLDRISRMVRINVEAAYRMAYVALKYFRSVQSGHLINTSSILGTKVRPNAGAYAGTKYAIEALSEALRMELAGSPIKVSCVEPGLVMTELHKDWEVHPKDLFNIRSPLVPDDIARAVRFLLEQPEHVRIPKIMVLPGEQQL